MRERPANISFPFFPGLLFFWMLRAVLFFDFFSFLPHVVIRVKVVVPIFPLFFFSSFPVRALCFWFLFLFFPALPAHQSDGKQEKRLTVKTSSSLSSFSCSLRPFLDAKSSLMTV